MSYDPKEVAFIDTETAGLHPNKHPIWQIAVIVDDEEHVWHQQMFGGGSRWKEWVDPWIIENNMNHILDDYDPAKALTLRTSVNTFVELVRGRHIVGCNPRFDIERIHRTWIAFHEDDWHEPWHYHLIDVGTLMLGHMIGEQRELNPNPLERVGLPWEMDELTGWHGVNRADFEPKHSALADARFARACFEAVMGGPQ